MPGHSSCIRVPDRRRSVRRTSCPVVAVGREPSRAPDRRRSVRRTSCPVVAVGREPGRAPDRRRSVRGLLLAAVLLAVAAAPAGADSLAGRIVDPQGGAVAGARLRLLDRAGGQVRAGASASDGGYAFADIPAGAYVLEARGAGGSLSGAAAVAVAGDRRLDLTVRVSGLAAEVVVTGAGTPLVVEEAAKALDVVDADEIARRNESSVAEALRTVPGLRVQTLGAPGSFTTVKTRGLRNQDTAILVDGMRFRDAASPQGDATAFLANLSTVDTERIEVLRGSGSSLYGSNAVAGVVNVTSRTGGGPAAGDVLVEGGGLGAFRALPSVRGGLDGDRLAYSGAVSALDVRHGVRGADPYRSVSPQGMVRYRFTPTLSATGRLWYARDRLRTTESPAFPDAVLANFPAEGAVRAAALPADQLARFERGLPFAAGAATFVPNQADPDAVRRSSFLTGSALVRHVAAPGVAWRVGYQAVDTRREHADGPLGGGPFESAARSSFHDGRTDTLQARLDAALGASNVLAAGYELERERYRDASTSHPGAIAIDGRSHALYAQNRLSLLDGRVQITLGGRVQAFDLSDPAFGAVSDLAGASVSGLSGGSATAPAGGAVAHPYRGAAALDAPAAVTGDAAVAWFIAGPGTKLRLHAGNAYRAPSPYERFGGWFSSWSGAYTYIGDPRLEPERAVSVDGGVDQWLFGERLQVGATVFHTDLRQTIIYDFASFPAAGDPFGRAYGYRNGGGGRARGIELSAHAAPGPSAILRASYTWTDSRFDAPTIGADFFAAPGVSRHLFTLAATGRVGDRTAVTFDLFAASDYSLSPFGALGRRLVFAGPVRADLVVRRDLRIGPGARVDAYAKVENLFDHHYTESGFLTPGRWAVAGLRVRY